jgi:hypothetical protein
VDDDGGDDMLTRSWTGTIIGPVNGVREGRIYQVKLVCDGGGLPRSTSSPAARRRALPLEVG